MSELVTINSPVGEFRIRESSWNEVTVQVGAESGRVHSPERRDSGPREASFRLLSGYLAASEIMDAAQVLIAGDYLCAQINAATEEQRKQAEEEEREREQRRQEEHERRAELIEERTERLLTEFIGETVKVRESGYKTMRQAVVEAQEKYDSPGEYYLRLNYLKDQRTQQVGRIKRLDVKVGAKWLKLWDDGKDDVYGELATSAAEVEQYDTKMEEWS